MLIECDIIVYDIYGPQWEEANWVVEYLNNQQELFQTPKKLILISSVMTWAKTKHEDGSDSPFTEEDYRKRKAHPNYKDHLALEKNVTKYGKGEKFKTSIISTGVVYHPDDGLFHHYLKV